MSKRASIYLSSKTMSILDVSKDDSLSGMINLIVGRYNEIVWRSMPALTRNEWCAIMDANNGTIINDDSHFDESPTMLWANVADSQGLDEKWNIDSKKLVAKMRAWSNAEGFAAIDAVGKFWKHCDLATDDALKKAGVRIAQ